MQPMYPIQRMQRMQQTQRVQIWHECFGQSILGNCWFCSNIITRNSFTFQRDCPRPICEVCAQALGDRHLFAEMVRQGINPPVIDPVFNAWPEIIMDIDS